MSHTQGGEDVGKLPNESAKPRPGGGTETVLLVEDEPPVRMLMRIVLERAGYQVLEATHGHEALKIWEKHPNRIQLLLTDIVMPEGMSGRELASRLQAGNPTLKVMFTSGYSADVASRELSLLEGTKLHPETLRPIKTPGRHSSGAGQLTPAFVGRVSCCGSNEAFSSACPQRAGSPCSRSPFKVPATAAYNQSNGKGGPHGIIFRHGPC